ncbi:MAG: hypothetical protein ACE37B_22445 [Ilumatobacter sp.]|jgi:hypothetical protein|uniref:hypothetical protein n=1 Tax=Ilumatobacter sp. TaxID=1967498 RepID=UPI00391BA3AD
MTIDRRIRPLPTGIATSARAAIIATAVASLLLTGCFTGERPSFDDEGANRAGTSTGSPDIDAVAERLDEVAGATFTATFVIETKFGSLTSTGTVVQTSDGQRTVTVERPAATTRYSILDGDEQTCNVLTGECESALNDARISDVGIPHTFYGPSFATRLRVSADRRIGESSAYTSPIAGRDARCVDVQVAGGTETFCSLDSGVLARFIGNDVTVELTSYSPDADPAMLAAT